MKTSSLICIGGHDIELSNLDKVYWPEENYTKGDLLVYYQNIASYILPYLKNRPVVLHRFPEGITKEGFYQKNVGVNPPPKWVKTIDIDHTKGTVSYIMIQDIASLIYAVNMGSIELHPFLSQANHLKNPDYLIFDLDPNDIAFGKVVETAHILHDILESENIESYCKTSGSRGLHVYIPLHHHYDYEQAKAIANVVAELVHQQMPKYTTLEHSLEKKKGKVYIDVLRNSWAQTTVCVYSVRPKSNATVSTPIRWDEVKTNLDPREFNIKTIFKRLEKVGDLFKPVLGKANIRNLEKLVKKASKF